MANHAITRRELLKWAGMGTAAAFVAGCGGQAPAPTAAPAAGGTPAKTSPTGAKTKLRFLITNIWVEMDQYLGEYMKANPNVEVEQIPGREKQPEMATSFIMAKDIPDIIGCEQNKAYPVWVKNKKFMPLPADFIKEMDVFDIAFKGASNADGTLNFMPYDLDPKPLSWFTKASLDEVKIDPAKFPTVLEEVLATYQKFVKKDAAGAITRYATYEYSNLWYYTMPWTLGYVTPKGDAGQLASYIGGSSDKDPFRFNNAEYIKGLAIYQKLFKGPTTCCSGKEDRIKGLKADYYAGLYDGSGNPWSVKKDAPEKAPMVYVPLPSEAGHLGRVDCVVHGWGVHVDSPNKNAAIDVMRFLMSEKIALEQYEKYGTMPSRKATFEACKKLDASKVPYPINAYEPQVKEAIAIPWALPWYGRVDAEVLNPMATKVAEGGEDPATVAAWAEKEANAILTGAK